ncbi:MAG TPA: hypothetical protein VM261_20080 [Kofleriaceae bacterium]|nr:hypothetical protein [Kofleriaceae bacterium]
MSNLGEPLARSLCALAFAFASACACGGAPAAKDTTAAGTGLGTGTGTGTGTDTPAHAAIAIPSRIKGRYALAGTATHVAPIAHARVFVTLDASGAAHVGAVGKDALDGGTLVSMPRQSEHGTDDTPAGTPLLRDTVAALLGTGAPPRILDAPSREELRTSGCTHWPPDQPRAVSWGSSKAMRFEVLAFARSAGDPTPAEATVLVADAAAPAIRLIQAADDVPVARIAVDRGKDDAVALALVVGGAVALGDPVCIAANRSVMIELGTIEVRGDGIDHESFGSFTMSEGTGTFDHDAFVTAYKAALAANQLGDRQTLVHVDHTVPVATLVGVMDAMLEAGETRFILHAMPDLSKP